MRNTITGRYNEKRWGSDLWVRGLVRSGEKDGAHFKNWKYGLLFLHFHRVWPNSFNAHRLVSYARSINFKKIDELNYRLFLRTYEEGGNISKIDELVQIANDLGIEGAEDMLRSDRFKEEVLEEDDFAKDDLEIQFGLSGSVMFRGVPYFVINDRYYLEGANPPAAFVSVFRMLERNSDSTSNEGTLPCSN